MIPNSFALNEVKYHYEPTEFSSNLFMLMFERHVTTREVARYVGCDNHSICNWINAKVYPSEKYAKKLCEFFDVTLEQIGWESMGDRRKKKKLEKQN